MGELGRQELHLGTICLSYQTRISCYFLL